MLTCARAANKLVADTKAAEKLQQQKDEEDAFKKAVQDRANEEDAKKSRLLNKVKAEFRTAEVEAETRWLSNALASGNVKLVKRKDGGVTRVIALVRGSAYAHSGDELSLFIKGNVYEIYGCAYKHIKLLHTIILYYLCLFCTHNCVLTTVFRMQTTKGRVLPRWRS